MHDSDLQDIEGAKAEGFSDGQFEFVVGCLDDGGAESLFEAEPVEDDFAMRPQHQSNALHGLEPGSHGALAPCVQETSGPERRVVLPEELELLLKQVGGNARIDTAR